MLSVVILTKNNADGIEQTLQSVSFSDDVIIVDDYSHDGTENVAEKYNCRFYQRHLENDFAGQRAYGLSLVKHRWVLFVDSDEIVPEELKNEIISCVSQDTQYKAFSLKRVDYFLGQELRFGEVQRVRNKGLTRLVRTDSGSWKGSVHEEFHATGSTGRLTNYLKHYPHPTISAFLADINWYSTIRAHELVTAGVRASVFQLIVYPFGKFIYTYFILRGFRDGAAGFVYAFMMSFHSFLVRAKVIQYTELDS